VRALFAYRNVVRLNGPRRSRLRWPCRVGGTRRATGRPGGVQAPGSMLPTGWIKEKASRPCLSNYRVEIFAGENQPVFPGHSAFCFKECTLLTCQMGVLVWSSASLFDIWTVFQVLIHTLPLCPILFFFLFCLFSLFCRTPVSKAIILS